MKVRFLFGRSLPSKRTSCLPPDPTARALTALFGSALAASLLSVSTPPASAQTVSAADSIALAPLAGPQYKPAPLQSGIGFYGTDLGFTMKHQGQLRILFGDSWSGPLTPSIGPLGDDCQGTICLQASGCPLGGTALATGSAVQTFTGTSGLFWTRSGPPLVFRRNAFGLVAPLPVYAGGSGGTLLDMGPLKTPVTAFSNGITSGSGGGAFGVFGRAEGVPCSAGCTSGFTCDGNGIGLTSAGVPCLLGGADCAAGAGGGICVDTTSPRRDPNSAAGRLRAAVWRMRIGNADPTIEEQYYTRIWNTHKFSNPAATTVEAYTLSAPVNHVRTGGASVANAAPASGAAAGTERVFIWGRPGFIGSSSYQAKLYLAVVDVPSYSANGGFAFQPYFYAGHVNGAPTFSDQETAAVALKDVNNSDVEPFDIVNQHSVRFVSALNKWVMLYGGDLEPALWETGTGVTRDPQGAIHVRFASQPWGPWSAPQALLIGGNPSAAPANQYAPGGVLHHGSCTPAASCIPGEPFWNALFSRDEPGFLYGANLIPEWSVDRGTKVDLYWNVSTWSPYQVVLMRSTVTK